ncbi:MAG: FKBP-type peptidyl-prolyl cis-trans isomerase [Lachnospiraceae bacterium]|nr:FKBP-type peptidyl-prolyl cis-trans isomerase [Lachnospiraceae bacterium]
MKKKFVLSIALFSMIAAFSSCSGSKEPEQVPDTPVEVTATSTPTNTPTPTATDTPTPTPSPIPLIVTDEKSNTIVFLSDYKGIKLEPVTDEALAERINEDLSNYSEEIEVERPAQLGDTVLIYFVGTVDGVPFAGGSYESGMGYELVLGSGKFINGFEDQLVGAKVDDVVDVVVTFPENYQSEELRGKEAHFKVTVNFILENRLPELTDEFVKENLNYENVAAYKEAVLDALTEKSYNDQIVDHLIKNFRIENLQDQAFTDFSDEMYYYYYKKAAYASAILKKDINDILYYYFGVPSLEALRQVSDQTASVRVPFEHILKAISIYENMELSEEEFFAWLDANHSDYGYDTSEDFVNDYGRQKLYDSAMTDKVYNFLLDNAIK